MVRLEFDAGQPTATATIKIDVEAYVRAIAITITDYQELAIAEHLVQRLTQERDERDATLRNLGYQPEGE